MALKVLLAGSRGLVGRAIYSELLSQNYDVNIFNPDKDLRKMSNIIETLKVTQPDILVIAAAKVGGIISNTTSPGEFIYDNLMIQCNLIHGVIEAGLASKCKIIFLGSSCAYPVLSRAIKEEDLLSGPLESTNKAYAVAKIAGIEMCSAYNTQYGLQSLVLMPCNIYGIGDHFEPGRGHVLASLVKKFCDAEKSGNEEVILWGDGTPRREFMHANDLAKAVIFFMDKFSGHQVLNIGNSVDYTIDELANKIKTYANFNGKHIYDTSKPNGVHQKLLDSSKMLSMGFTPTISLDTGIQEMIRMYRQL